MLGSLRPSGAHAYAHAADARHLLSVERFFEEGDAPLSVCGDLLLCSERSARFLERRSARHERLVLLLYNLRRIGTEEGCVRAPHALESHSPP